MEVDESNYDQFGKKRKYNESIDDLLEDLDNDFFEDSKLDQFEEEANIYFASQSLTNLNKNVNQSEREEKCVNFQEMKEKISFLEKELQTVRSRACVLEMASSKRNNEMELNMQQEIDRLKSIVEFQQHELYFDKMKNKGLSINNNKNSLSQVDKSKPCSMYLKDISKPPSHFILNNPYEKLYLDTSLSKEFTFLSDLSSSSGSKEWMNEISTSDKFLGYISNIIWEYLLHLMPNQETESKIIVDFCLKLIQFLPNDKISSSVCARVLRTISFALLKYYQSPFNWQSNSKLFFEWLDRLTELASNTTNWAEKDEINLLEALINLSEYMLITNLSIIFFEKPVCLLSTISNLFHTRIHLKSSRLHFFYKLLSLFNSHVLSVNLKNDVSCKKELTPQIINCDCLFSFTDIFVENIRKLIPKLEKSTSFYSNNNNYFLKTIFTTSIETMRILWNMNLSISSDILCKNMQWMIFYSRWSLSWILNQTDIDKEYVVILENITNHERQIQ